MRNNKVNQLIKELNKKISQEYPDFEGCYLYGSRAKKTHHKNSDVDIIAIFNSVDRERDYEIGGIVNELMYNYDVYIDFRVYTLDNLTKNPVYYDEVVNKGIYYAAA